MQEAPLVGDLTLFGSELVPEVLELLVRDLTKTALPSSRVVAIDYDPRGRLTATRYEEADVVIAYADATERPARVSRTSRNGNERHQATLTYDGRRRPPEIGRKS